MRVSMDGRGRWMDNVFVERLWRTVKASGGSDVQNAQPNKGAAANRRLPLHFDGWMKFESHRAAPAPGSNLAFFVFDWFTIVLWLVPCELSLPARSII